MTTTKAPKLAPKKRDPLKTARNKRIQALKDKLRDLLPAVLEETGHSDERSFSGRSVAK